VTYTPTSNWRGSDSFTYTVSDGVALPTGGADTATVTITTQPPEQWQYGCGADGMQIGTPGVVPAEPM